MILLLVLALILAWPTAGLSLVAYFALVFVRIYFSAKIRRRRASTISAIREVQAGNGHPPSWVSDSTQSSAFIGATISEATRKGVRQSFITSHFKSNENKAALLCLVGLMEDKGFSVREQGIAATDFICEIWKIESNRVALLKESEQQLKELLSDSSVHYEIRIFVRHGFVGGVFGDVTDQVLKCIDIAKHISTLTNQPVKEILALAADIPIKEAQTQ